MMKRYMTIRGSYLCLMGFLICCKIQPGKAQLFPGLEGEALVVALRQAYTPGQLLNDTQVKDTLYARVFIEQDDTVRCIYSALPRYLPTGVDPSQWLFGAGTEIGSINLEHGWPQAKGAGEGTNGHMDMHHLYPSRTAINSDRANFPLMDIQDNLTQKWYYLDQEMASIPSADIDAYSEFRSGVFEPREAAKGDMARAMFYFWTIYRSDAMEADPLFFDLQKDDLCQWHLQDPVDEFEAVRNDRIATYQEGKKNPFILDCTLAGRAYCDQLPPCDPVSVTLPTEDAVHFYFDPALRLIALKGAMEAELWRIRILDILGHALIEGTLEVGAAMQIVHLPAGIYLVIASQGERAITQKIFIP